MADGRKSNGGHSTKGRAGRPKKDTELAKAEMLKKMRSGVSDKDIELITKNLVKEAKGGSVQHTKLLFEYIFGKPSQAVEVSGKDENGGIGINVKTITVDWSS